MKKTTCKYKCPLIIHVPEYLHFLPSRVIRSSFKEQASFEIWWYHTATREGRAIKPRKMNCPQQRNGGQRLQIDLCSIKWSGHFIFFLNFKLKDVPLVMFRKSSLLVMEVVLLECKICKYTIFHVTALTGKRDVMCNWEFKWAKFLTISSLPISGSLHSGQSSSLFLHHCLQTALAAVFCRAA